MIFIACLSCHLTLQVEGDNSEVNTLVGTASEYWPTGYTCSDCGKPARGLLAQEISAQAASKLRVVCVTPQEAFAALNGLGLPEERSCQLQDVQDLLSSVGIRSIRGKNIRGATHCVVDYLELKDGSKVYLGPSMEGAVIYRITRPHSYVKEQFGDDNG